MFPEFFFIADGLDFFFASESNARKLVDFLQSVIPVRYNHSKKLISHDDHSNTFNYKVSLLGINLFKDKVKFLSIAFNFESDVNLNCKSHTNPFAVFKSNVPRVMPIAPVFTMV